MAISVNRTAKAGTASAAAPASVAAIPFVRAARKKTAAATVLTGTVGANAVQLPVVQVPAAGYLRGVELLVQVVTASNSATTAYNADAPFNFINSINLVASDGSSLVSNIGGYGLFLTNKYGNFRAQAPFCDPRADQFFTQTSGSGGTGGSFSFRLFIPVEADAAGFCAIPNLAANKSYNINVQLAGSSTVYSTAPTNAGSYTITVINHYWSQPAQTNANGIPQQIAPNGVGSVMLTQFQSIPVTQGDRLVQLTNVGNVLKNLFFVLRNSSNARIETNGWGATNQLILNNDTLFYWNAPLGTTTKDSWNSSMTDAYGYGNAVNATAPGTASTIDAAGGLDTGVRVVPYFNDLSGGFVSPNTSRDQFLPTLDSTLLQLRSTSFGSAASTLEVFTMSVKPTTAQALYTNNA
jgi:hypothetical protein